MTIYLGPGELAFDVCKWPKALVRVIHLNGSYVPEAEVNLGFLDDCLLEAIYLARLGNY